MACNEINEKLFINWKKYASQQKAQILHWYEELKNGVKDI